MQITIYGKNIHVSNYLKELTIKKLGKLDKYFYDETVVQVTLSVEKTRHIVEVTIPFGGVMLRAEEVSGDMYASIDKVVDKIEKQIMKHRTKLEKSLHKTVFKDIKEEMPDNEQEDQAKIVKKKRFDFKPMSIEEAILQLDLIDHNFFIFTNSDTNSVNILYKRKDGELGLIEPGDM